MTRRLNPLTANNTLSEDASLFPLERERRSFVIKTYGYHTARKIFRNIFNLSSKVNEVLNKASVKMICLFQKLTGNKCRRLLKKVAYRMKKRNNIRKKYGHQKCLPLVNHIIRNYSGWVFSALFINNFKFKIIKSLYITWNFSK